MTENQSYEIRYPSSRQLTFDVGSIGRRKHHVKALLEIDVTDARTKIRQIRQSGGKASFTAWLIKSIADCVALHPPISGINRPRANKVVVFGDVDISIVIEKEVNGVRVPLPYVIRKADQKPISQIRDEIVAVKSQAFEDEGDYVLGKKHDPVAMKMFVKIPQWLRLALMRVIYFDNPKRLKNAMGTVMITTVGMASRFKGWIVPFSIHPLCLALGSVNVQPSVHNGEIQKREILHMTVLIDHDVIDGMPAARFVEDLARKLEDGFGL